MSITAQIEKNWSDRHTELAARQKEALRNKSQIMPDDVTTRLYGDRLHPALFSWYNNDIISDVAYDPAAFEAWLPARAVTNWKEPVAHLSWVAPDGFDGTQSYQDFLASQPAIDECDFGDGYTYNICEYIHTMERISASTRNEPIKQENLGMKLFEKQPTVILRGDNAGLNISNDRDWSIARLGMGMQEHQRWNMIYGNENAYTNTYTGVNEIFTNNWVRNHARQKGSCDFTDPIVVNGVNLSTNEDILRQIRVLVRRLRRRMRQRGYDPVGDDMAIMLNDTMWDYISDSISFGVMSTFNAPEGFELIVTPDVVAKERDRVRTGGVGYGFIPVDGLMVPVIPETRMGASSTIGSQPAVTSDIFVMTKRFRGMTILEHQYLDWRALGDMPLPDYQNVGSAFMPQYFQNGMMRVTVNQLNPANNLCWYYGADMWGRIVSYMNSLQGRINDVTVLTDVSDENESSSFTSPNFYAFDGVAGGAGTALLEPIA